MKPSLEVLRSATQSPGRPSALGGQFQALSLVYPERWEDHHFVLRRCVPNLFLHLKESAGAADGNDHPAQALGVATVMHQIPSGQGLWRNVPRQGHQAGGDSDSLPLKLGFKVVIIRHQLPFSSIRRVTRVVRFPIPHRAKAAVPFGVVPRVGAPDFHAGCGSGVVSARSDVLLHITELAPHGRIIHHHLGLALHHPRAGGQLRLHAGEGLLSIRHVLCHLHKYLSHRLVGVRSIRGKAAFIPLVLILLEGGDIACVAARHIVQHHLCSLIHDTLLYEDCFDRLTRLLPSHGRKLARNGDDDQTADPHHLETEH
mmetsp:Transcript_52020/g.122055  ORF Transcript_52020/g.122055 Transcript_52020/m.122055 type:complete len:314 (-) Transcript_52020:1469-2410(-)